LIMTSQFSPLYSKKVIDLIKNPRNMGEIKNPDGVATVGNRVCGDIMRLYIRIRNKGSREYIKDIKFQTLGCAAAIASSSILTEIAKGKSLKTAQKITNQEVVRKLGGLPEAKLHCSVLAVEALQKAIDYYKKNEKK